MLPKYSKKQTMPPGLKPIRMMTGDGLGDIDLEDSQKGLPE